MVLASFGVMGYLRFGDGVEQMINANIPSGSWLSIAVNVCLCIGVLLTFPLMIYPVIDLAEIHLFGKELPLGIKVKDITIIVLGVACGIAGIYTVLVEIVNNVKP
nr:hypothetical protein BaRGS_024368 [Batillaria attramentaria]